MHYIYNMNNALLYITYTTLGFEFVSVEEEDEANNIHDFSYLLRLTKQIDIRELGIGYLLVMMMRTV